MNENTIFQNPASRGQNQVGPSQNQASRGAGDSSTPVPPGGAPPFVFHSSKPPISPKGILKVLIGIFVVVLIGYLVFTIVIPRLQQTSESEVTLVYWGLWEDASVIQPIIADFNKEYPHVKVNYSKQDHKQYGERLVTRIRNETGPDIFRFHNTWVDMLSGILMPLPNDTINKAEFTKSFYPVVQKDLIKGGAIYGAPLGIDTLALYINKSIFDSAGLSPPTNWVDFINVARSLTVKDGSGQIRISGAALGTFSNVTHAPDIVSLLMVQNGVDLNNIAGDREATAEALAFYTSFVTAGGSSTWSSTLDQSVVEFAKGNLAMYFGFSWDFFTIEAINPDLDFEIHPVPHLPNRSMTIASYWVEGVSAKSRHQKEALLFMKFLAKKDTTIKFFTEASKTRAFGEPYARVDLADSLKDNNFVYPFVSQGNNAVSSFFASDTHDSGINSQMNTYLGDAVNSIIRGGSPQSAVATLIEGVNQVLVQYSSPATEPR